MEYSTKSVTLITPLEILDTLVISKSTTGKAVILSMEALLLDLLVSFSLLVTTTTFEIVPFEITCA